VIQSAWYFPGDPPVPDLAATLGCGVALAGALLAGVVYLLLGRSHHAVRAALVGSLPGLLVAAPGVVVIGYRHLGAWREVRDAIRHYDAAIARDAHPGVLTELEFSTLRAKHVPRPIPLYFPGSQRPVYLRMAHGTPPYVGIDFGGGANAAFDPVTMVCTYSD
jgi:hypothetical protein